MKDTNPVYKVTFNDRSGYYWTHSFLQACICLNEGHTVILLEDWKG